MYKYQQNVRLKPLICRRDVSLRPDGRDLSLTRQLGHRETIPGSGQWQMLTDGAPDACWHCDNWLYTLIFWSPTIARRAAERSQSTDDASVAE